MHDIQAIAKSHSETPAIRVSLAGVDVSHLLLSGRAPRLQNRLDYPNYNEFNTSHITLALTDNGQFASGVDPNFFTRNGVDATGFRAEVRVEIGFQTANTFTGKTVFVGELISIKNNTREKSVEMTFSDKSYLLRKARLDDFGKERELVATFGEAFANGTYKIHPDQAPIYPQTVRAWQGTPDNRAFYTRWQKGTTLQRVASVRSEGNLAPTNFQVVSDGILTEGGSLENNPIVAFKEPYRWRRIENLIREIASDFNIAISSGDVSVPVWQESDNFFATHGRPGWETDDYKQSNFFREFHWTGAPRALSMARSGTNDGNFYILYGDTYSFEDNTPNFGFLEWNPETDAWNDFGITGLELSNFDTEDGVNFYAIATGEQLDPTTTLVGTKPALYHYSRMSDSFTKVADNVVPGIRYDSGETHQQADARSNVRVHNNRAYFVRQRRIAANSFRTELMQRTGTANAAIRTINATTPQPLNFEILDDGTLIAVGVAPPTAAVEPPNIYTQQPPSIRPLIPSDKTIYYAQISIDHPTFSETFSPGRVAQQKPSLVYSPPRLSISQSRLSVAAPTLDISQSAISVQDTSLSFSQGPISHDTPSIDISFQPQTVSFQPPMISTRSGTLSISHARTRVGQLTLQGTLTASVPLISTTDSEYGITHVSLGAVSVNQALSINRRGFQAGSLSYTFRGTSISVNSARISTTAGNVSHSFDAGSISQGAISYAFDAGGVSQKAISYDFDAGSVSLGSVSYSFDAGRTSFIYNPLVITPPTLSFSVFTGVHSQHIITSDIPAYQPPPSQAPPSLKAPTNIDHPNTAQNGSQITVWERNTTGTWRTIGTQRVRGKVISVSELTKAGDYIYFNMQYERGTHTDGGTLQPSASQLSRMHTNGTYQELQYYDFFEQGPSAVATLGNDAYFFRGGIEQKSPIPLRPRYREDTGGFLRITPAGQKIDAGLNWRSGINREEGAGWGRHSTTNGRMITKDDTIFFLSGFKEFENQQYDRSSLNIEPSNRATNWQLLQYGENNPMRIPKLPTQGKSPWAVLLELAYLTNCIISFNTGRLTFKARTDTIVYNVGEDLIMNIHITPDMENLFNRVTANYGEGFQHTTQDAASISSHGEHNYSIDIPYLTHHDRLWVERLAERYLEDNKEIRFLIDAELIWSPHLELGQAIILTHSSLPMSPVYARLLRITHDTNRWTTSIQARTF